MIQKLKYLYAFILCLMLPYITYAQEGEVTIFQDSAIDKLLDYKKDIKTTKVYKIHVYQSDDPDIARREKYKFLNAYEDWPVNIEWQTPNYKIWVGNFTTRLEAFRALVKIKKRYINATIFQPKTDED